MRHHGAMVRWPGVGDRSGVSGKMLIPLFGVLAALALIVAAAAMVLQRQEREKRIALERDVAQARAEVETLKTDLDALQGAKAKVEEELVHAKMELTTAQEQATKALEAQATLSRSVEDREREITRLSKDLEQARHDHQQVASELSELRSERETMKQRLADLEKAKGDLESKVLELADATPTVELDKVVVGSAGESAVPMPVSLSTGSMPAGQVVVVNREYDFIVMNMGKNHGVSIGQQFQVVHGNEPLGTVKVEKVYDELSAAAILPNSKKDKIQEGDTVRGM